MTKNKYIGRKCYISMMKGPCLISMDGETQIRLDQREYEILEYLIDNKNIALSKEEIGERIWGYNHENDIENIRCHISNIRKKLNQVEEGLSSCIQTIHRSHQYMLVIDDPIIGNQDTSVPINEIKGIFKNEKGEVFSAQYSDLKKLGYSAISIAEKLVKNDMVLYGSIFQERAITPENEGTALQWAEYLSSVPESFQYLVNSQGEIVGNFSFVSLTTAQEKEYLDGYLVEESFTPSNTRDIFTAGKDHILFLLNLSINDEYSTLENNTILRKMFLEELISLAENDVYFKKIITNVYKSSQEAFYKEWGFRFVKEHHLSGRIYELELIPYPQILNDQLNNNTRLAETNERLKKYYE